MKRFGIVTAIFLLSATRSGLAADVDGRYAIHEDRACWDYVVRIDTAYLSQLNMVELEKHAAWIAGYVTAYNRQMPDTYSIVGGGDLNTAMFWLVDWCRANPTSKMDTAMHALTEEFHRRRYRTAKEAIK